jgi:hypothetical protein
MAGTHNPGYAKQALDGLLVLATAPSAASAENKFLPPLDSVWLAGDYAKGLDSGALERCW